MIGKTLGNRYEIIERIGGGGMALVYKAKCRLLNRFVAIKVLRHEFINDEEFINKFKRESQAAASLSHNNIVNIYDVGAENNIYYIVMEYIKGRTLKQLINENGKLGAQQTIDIAIQIAEALNHAHKNHIVHRDIKPHNIMITDDERIKVMDFGIARAATASTVTNTSNVIGSVHYFSPEQARGGYTDAKSDIYSLGIVMYEMITGSVPFQGESPISVALKHIQEEVVFPNNIDKSIPKNLIKIVKKAVEKDQSLRYDSAEEILDDLRKANTSEAEDIIEYKNFIDSPTRMIPAIKDDIIMEKGKIKKRTEKNKGKKENNELSEKKASNKVATLMAIILALIITCSIAYAYLKSNDFFAAQEVEVPYLIGLELDEAEDKLKERELELDVKYDNNDKYNEGHIFYQSETDGNKVRPGWVVEVKVSMGPKLAEVPNLINENSNEAEILLSQAGLIEGNITSEYSEYPIGIVISQTPEAFEKIKEGTEVNYVISNGPEKSFLIMPNLKTLDKTTAKREILRNGFIVGNIEKEPNNDIPIGIVIWQSHPAGSEVEENTTIDLIVSSGPETTDLNEENNDQDTENNSDDNTENVENNDSQEDQEEQQQETVKKFEINLPDDMEEVMVKVYKVQEGEKKLVYSQKHQTSEGTVSVNVSGKGLVKIIIEFDDEVKLEKEFDF